MQSAPPPVVPEMRQNSTMWVWVILAVAVVAALALWYFFPKQATAPTSGTAADLSQSAALSSGNTTADISADLNQTLDDAAALDAAAAASAQDVSGF